MDTKPFEARSIRWVAIENRFQRAWSLKERLHARQQFHLARIITSTGPDAAWIAKNDQLNDAMHRITKLTNALAAQRRKAYAELYSAAREAVFGSLSASTQKEP